MKAAIIGTTGYGGAELIRLLTHHPVFSIHSIHSSREEVPISDEYPHLSGILENRLEKIDPGKIAQEADIVFLAAPSGASGQLAAAFSKMDIQIVDLSGDLRLKNTEDYKNWYQLEPIHPSVIEKAVYGLSEWNRPQIESARLVANPGCYPTAVLLGLGPLVQEKWIEPSSIIIDAKSGVSGAGRSVTRGVHFSELNENLKIYKVNAHQHTPEIEQQLALWNDSIQPVTFSTHLLPITRGIMATMYVQLKNDIDTADLWNLYHEAYLKHPFVRVRNIGHFPAIKEVCGSNFCDIGMHVDQRTGRATIVSVIDNLMKGAAGQAVQNANIMNGIDEHAGLDLVPLYP